MNATHHTAVTEIAEGKRPAPASSWGNFEALLERLSERLNPILVKEARQALKSRQFVVTFSLLLLCGWLWSILGVALLSPGIHYMPGGRAMLIGYFVILALPVLLVVPFSAFRSLAAEREDGTFELLSITALGSRQIVTGKLGSAVLQMLVYYSALSPCLAFTYLLRGIDVFTILFILLVTLLGSILFSSVALLVATASRARHWQVILSVLLLIGLVIATVGWIASISELITTSQPLPYETTGFWQVVLAVVTMIASFVALCVIAAAGQISFASDNRATPIRVVLFVQQVLWIGWMTLAMVAGEEAEVVYPMVVVAAIYWYVLGALMNGERAELSPRVKRSLPHSFLGRVLLTWFNPGSGTGFCFAVVNLLAVVLVAVGLAVAAEPLAGDTLRGMDDWLAFAALSWVYVVLYLGTGRLLVLAARRVVPAGVLVSGCLQAVLPAVGALAPLLVQAWWQGYRDLSYSALQFPNWAWSLSVAASGDMWAYPDAFVLTVASAGIVLVVNLLFAMHEVAQVRQNTPRRVLEDQQQPAPNGPVPLP